MERYRVIQPIYRDPFHALTLTVVTNSKGDMTEFWTSSWLQGGLTKSIAPFPYKKKEETRFLPLHDHKWVRHISPI